MTGTRGTTIYLTKSDFLNFRVCPAYCWTAKYRPDQVPEAPVDALRRARDGDMVEALARNVYPEGLLIDVEDPARATRATEHAIANGATTLFQASVLTRTGLHARADVLVRDRSGHGWHLIEIKSSTSVDFDHKMDATFQRIAFGEAGYHLRSVQVMYLDRRYRMDGTVDLKHLFRFDRNITAWSEARLSDTMTEIDRALETVRAVDTCPPCECHRKTRGKRCPTFAVFNPDFPVGNTVYDLISINQKRLTEVLDRGVLHLDDWPGDLTLNGRQRWQIETTASGAERVMPKKLQRFLATIQRPCYFLDYETVQIPVPQYAGTWPYQQLPFQYSVHVLDEDGTLEHREFLWTDGDSCPIEPLVESLRQDIGDDGSVLVWWKGFEGKRNMEMAASVPHLADFLLGLNDRMIDLMETVNQGLWVHPDFCGSASIKKVLPVVAPELSYDLLEIGSGALATLRWKQCVIDDTPPEDIDPEETFHHLRDYCRRDTLAMVRIWEYLSTLVDTAATPVDTHAAARR